MPSRHESPNNMALAAGGSNCYRGASSRQNRTAVFPRVRNARCRRDESLPSGDDSLSLEDHMPKFIIERELAGAGKLTPEQLQGISQKSCSVLTQLGPKI